VTVRLFLGIDGGNSKTDVVIGIADGAVLAFIRGPGSSPHALGQAPALALLVALVERARRVADLDDEAPIGRAAVMLAGADLPVEVARLQAAWDARALAESSTVDNDTFALLRAGTNAGDAVAVVCGAGINCVGRTADGRTARFSSLGEISGDWGGGDHLATLALWHAARGEDGRGPATALSRAVADHFDRATIAEVSAGLHLGEIPYRNLRPLAELLFAVATDGDPVARGVIARQAGEIVALGRAMATTLGLLDRPHCLVLGGGVLRARQPLLHDAILAGVGGYAPLAFVTVVEDPPVVGAALLALDGLGPSPGAEMVLRNALRAPPVVVQ
jgi:N-acetylglucosamine kinase-like BadF-type ATPase